MSLANALKKAASKTLSKLGGNVTIRKVTAGSYNTTTGVRKPDTYINTYATGFPFRITTDYFTDTEIPEQVKKAQVILAVYLNNNRNGLGLSGLEDYKNVKIGNLEATPNFYGAVGADRVPPLFERYFTGLRHSGPANVAIKRS